ncbi:MAG TPA: FlgD immunoglobulin-like domain containing protein, partial [Candidatus Cloacimonas sp.]|nr:FlgD immunoglobulin-like domain containing protein [Candidatus Cloacimonas sp.]
LIANNGNIYIMDGMGVDLPNTPIGINTAVECTPVIARFDGGNNAGIIFGDSSGKLHSVRIDGTESPNFPIEIGGILKVSPTLADIDGDNDLEIAFPTNSGLSIIDVKRGAQALLWPNYLGGFGRTCNAYQPTPIVDPQLPALETVLYEAYPNPFNPETTISFNLSSPNLTELYIYNQKGQKVKTLFSGNLESGNHKFVWNGQDDNGNSVSSGLYFYRMKSGKYSSTKKMILMK